MKKTAEIKKLEEAVVDLEQKWKRALADYQNLEKRVSNQQQTYAKLASLGLIDKLLPVLDDLERATKHIKEDGLLMVVKQLVQVLESEDVTKINALGLEFDPNIMDCAEMVKGKKNVVVEVTQEGYLLNETVIRPTKVRVGDGSKK